MATSSPTTPRPDRKRLRPSSPLSSWTLRDALRTSSSSYASVSSPARMKAETIQEQGRVPLETYENPPTVTQPAPPQTYYSSSQLDLPRPTASVSLHAKAHIRKLDDEAGTTYLVPALESAIHKLPNGTKVYHPFHASPQATLFHLRSPALTSQALDIMLPDILYQQFSCKQKCRNRGTCTHYLFILGARRTPDGLICRKCALHEACQPESAISSQCKMPGSRVCPVHNKDNGEIVLQPTNGATAGTAAQTRSKGMAERRKAGDPSNIPNPNTHIRHINLPVDYLATPSQRVAAAEVLERAWTGNWADLDTPLPVEEYQYASAHDFEGLEEVGSGASAMEDNTKQVTWAPPMTEKSYFASSRRPFEQQPQGWQREGVREIPRSVPQTMTEVEGRMDLGGYAYVSDLEGAQRSGDDGGG
ncbi:uncharacterized protein AB675_2813 [Cyphellophora attinorum]|uniref:Uncharacterized protein n=1 Tax=Cyphellophora attinorum TaxID=1664694 RepID=A0A0N0NRS2_9EURO|nr:uncharacterized protein AB675_2813 [Phialophora attinorum]KPI45159.1 hypothetical protein AB675_2813 [Phialophora attinorum]